MTPSDFEPRKGRLAAVNLIEQFAKNTRKQALTSGEVYSRQKNGVVPENPVGYESAEGGLRQPETALGTISVSKNIQNADFTLVIKHNALFTALLPELREAFPVYGIVRNPLSVLASWNSVALPVNEGRIPAGEMYSPDLADLLADTPGRIERQLHILEWFCQRFLNELPNRILRYEDFVVDPRVIGQALSLSSPYTGNIQTRASRNDAYDLVLMEQLYRRLMRFGDAIWEFYSRDQITELMESIREAA
ncbi:hypothetical protein GCM10011613_29080 [Cellvibrio zantedeschiae]|uniref:Sulfotransferase family protein n=2 Tax=Cellvibrio zantedeschiae TaxID=1237077 RepID=A0ABQ3B8J7_9GAMM|nr:hypothetical protein GCM10011613_29080 [Cellvibrio zantedeschiae]